MKTLEVIEPLTPAESGELERLEFVIKSAQKHVDRWIEAVRAIRDGRLYRAEFSTFADYCEAKLKLQLRAVQLALQIEDVRASVIHGSHDDDQQTQALAAGASAKTLRALAPVAPESRPAVLRAAAAETGGKPTGAAVTRAAARLAHKPIETVPVTRDYSGAYSSGHGGFAAKVSGMADLPAIAYSKPEPVDELPTVTDAESAVARLEAIYERDKPWFNALPQRLASAIVDRLKEGMRE